MSDPLESQAIMFDEPKEQPLRAVRGMEAPGEDQPGREPITFEQGYEELKTIVSRLDDPELPVHEMFEGFRRGKGLEKALRAYLQEREGELSELEEGNNLPEFEITAPSES
jgi:exodeoxyribonuclease VII small subunit